MANFLKFRRQTPGKTQSKKPGVAEPKQNFRHDKGKRNNNHNTQQRQQKGQKTFWEHYAILRRTLLQCLAIYFIFSCLSLAIYETSLPYLIRPLLIAMAQKPMHLNGTIGQIDEQKLIFTHIMEGFATQFNFALTCGFILAFPFIIQRVYSFIAPALKPTTRRQFAIYLLFAPMLFLLGSALAYYYVMPLAWKFFLSYQNKMVIVDIPGTNEANLAKAAFSLQLQAKISEYLQSFIQIMLAFGLAFQLPLIMLILDKFGIFPKEKLRYYRRHAIIVIFILAALLTPPDVLSQVSLALPMLLLYELGILLCSWQHKKK